MRYQPIDPQLFIHNRERLSQALGSDRYIVLKAAPGDIGSESEGVYRQNRNFFWATGIDQPGAVLVVAPGHADSGLREVLFVKQPGEFERRWNGERLSPELARAISGIQTVLPMARLGAFKKSLRQSLAKTEETMPPLRMVKSPGEIKLIRQAIDITARGLTQVIPMVKGGVKEYELEAELVYASVAAGGAQSFAIIASGQATCTLHYRENDQSLVGGQLLLADVGSEYANYAADITRVYPIGGRFSPRQRAVYEAVLRVQKEAAKLMRPGVLIRSIQIKADEIMLGELQKLGLLPASVTTKTADWRQQVHDYFPHGLSHFLGLDVHDAGDYDRPLEPGVVISNEPGIYLPKEGIGVRLEDDILITATGSERLSAAIPIEPDEIERLMAQA